MGISKVILILIQIFWFILPAYAANAFPPLLRGKRPLDFGKSWRGKPILGKGKTIEGTIGGIIFGCLVGFSQLYFQSYVETYLPLIELTPILVVLLSAGAILGDIVASFFKRRAGIKRGEPVPLMDQLDFILGALLLSSIFKRLPLLHFSLIIVLTPLIHLLANGISYLLKIKSVPY
ncbi:MAG: CDP-2,3-bis-(O-geranylgeranyl)-sn-glycerol synthase [Clostridiales bacterium]|nr:CDP-2,3-bis-(O-geranylgeranyl)-sn-glycerol synthase [Clostridiales bacterium]